ncbi:MAG: OmpA family protein [Acidobacteria bacterium]|nr:OmpA family protein [Acidobacteriota bacterium]
MTHRTAHFLMTALAAIAAVAAVGCGSRSVPVAAPHPLDTSLVSPTGSGRSTLPPKLTIAVEPSSILRGEKALLRWNAENGTRARIAPAIGVVDLQGVREVSPTQDTVYTLTVEGPGGTATQSATLKVLSSELSGGRSNVSSEDLDVPFDSMVGRIQDVYFDYDAAGLRPEMEQVLLENGRLLTDLFARFPTGTVLVEGHCDERGTNEYNLALGDRRALSVKERLTAQGVPADRIRTVSLGEERPQCFESSESCWSRNRRAHFTPMP